MSSYGNRGHDVRRRIGSTGRQEQLAVVAGYAWIPKSLRAEIYLACGMLPSGLLRYSGKVTIVFASAGERRAFAKKTSAMRLGKRHPLLASPLPCGMVYLAPQLLAVVSHQGWTAGGLMRGIALARFRMAEEPTAAKWKGPRIVAEP